MIGRFASIGGGASREAFMAHAGELINKAIEAGTYVEGPYPQASVARALIFKAYTLISGRGMQ